MGTCPGCARDAHDAHQSYYPVSWNRKGQHSGSRQAICECPCTKKAP